jgi:hypothetical protein
MLASWMLSGIGVLLAATAWMRGRADLRTALALAVPFVALPIGSGLVSKYRLSRIAAVRHRSPQQVVHGAAPAGATREVADQTGDLSMAMRPRTVRLTMRGCTYIAGVAMATAVVLRLLLLSVGLWGAAGQSSGGIVKEVLALFVWGWALWSCISFFRNRIRERQLFANGELSQGLVLRRTETRYRTLITYTYRDATGNGFQQRATDFSSKLYEEMPIRVFYDPTNSLMSAALESSLYRVG